MGFYQSTSKNKHRTTIHNFATQYKKPSRNEHQIQKLTSVTSLAIPDLSAAIISGHYKADKQKLLA